MPLLAQQNHRSHGDLGWRFGIAGAQAAGDFSHAAGPREVAAAEAQCGESGGRQFNTALNDGPASALSALSCLLFQAKARAALSCAGGSPQVSSG